MFHKEGFKIILVTLFIVIGVSLIAHYFVDILWLKKGIQLLAIVFLIAILQFFRNPKRVSPREVLGSMASKSFRRKRTYYRSGR